MCGCNQAQQVRLALPPLTLQQVRDHGFIVLEAGFEYDVRGDRMRPGVVCAGTLDDCLAYLRDRPWSADSWPLPAADSGVAAAA